MKSNKTSLKLLKTLGTVMGFAYFILGFIFLFVNPIPDYITDMYAILFGILLLSYGCLRIWRSLFKEKNNVLSE